jgi:NADPH-dependent 2,4-dienoyl-CoA reductase/sulfur reductase-like enzyme
MNRESTCQFDVLVVGGGPAGMAAAVSAAEAGRRVGIVDDNPHLGGQIWRGEVSNSGSEASKWAEKLRAAEGELLLGVRVFDQPEAGILFAESSEQSFKLRFQKLVLATGARERFLPFPGWTLPGVMGAGGLQSLVKSGLPIAGKRVVVAGSGPLLLAVAAYLRDHGAEIPIICEQASWASLARFGAGLLRYPEKISQALSLRKNLSGVCFAASSWPLAAEGEERIERVVISRGHKTERIICDYLACGFHLVPNTELAALLGCKIDKGYVRVDDLQQTSAPGVFCAGEPTGIGGLELSLIEGQIAGFTAAERNENAKALFKARENANTFAQIIEHTFSLRPELRGIPLPETIICRCEDVTYDRLRRHTSWRSGKLHTRCGMGPCQGRVCGPVAQFLFDWAPDSVRPPIFPARFESLNAAIDQQQKVQTEVTGEYE